MPLSHHDPRSGSSPVPIVVLQRSRSHRVEHRGELVTRVVFQAASAWTSPSCAFLFCLVPGLVAGGAGLGGRETTCRRRISGYASLRRPDPAQARTPSRPASVRLPGRPASIGSRPERRPGTGRSREPAKAESRSNRISPSPRKSAGRSRPGEVGHRCPAGRIQQARAADPEGKAVRAGAEAKLIHEHTQMTKNRLAGLSYSERIIASFRVRPSNFTLIRGSAKR